jgi:hypothetical protein
MKLLFELENVSMTKNEIKHFREHAPFSILLGKNISYDLLKKLSFASGNVSGGKWVALDTQDSSILQKVKKLLSADEKNKELSLIYTMINRACNMNAILFGIDSKGEVQVGVSMTNARTDSADTFAIAKLAAKSSGSSIKAHDLYAAFIKSGYILTADEQTDAGIKVWQKLAKVSGITVFGWDTKRDEPVNLGKTFDAGETHFGKASGIDSIVTRMRMSTKEHDDLPMSNLILIASQKGKKIK